MHVSVFGFASACVWTYLRSPAFALCVSPLTDPVSPEISGDYCEEPVGVSLVSKGKPWTILCGTLQVTCKSICSFAPQSAFGVLTWQVHDMATGNGYKMTEANKITTKEDSSGILSFTVSYTLLCKGLEPLLIFSFCFQGARL